MLQGRLFVESEKKQGSLTTDGLSWNAGLSHHLQPMIWMVIHDSGCPQVTLRLSTEPAAGSVAGDAVMCREGEPHQVESWRGWGAKEQGHLDT